MFGWKLITETEYKELLDLRISRERYHDKVLKIRHELYNQMHEQFERESCEHHHHDMSIHEAYQKEAEELQNKIDKQQDKITKLYSDIDKLQGIKKKRK